MKYEPLTSGPPLWYEGVSDDPEGTDCFNLLPSVLYKRMRNMAHPNFFVGPDPVTSPFIKREADFFDVIINVGDNLYTFAQGPSRPGQQVLWYPLVEMGKWHFSSLFPILTTLDMAVKNNWKVYVHCAAGAYRSPGVLELWNISHGNPPLTKREYVKDHCPEFPIFAERWRRLQKEGKQFSLMSMMMQYEPRIGLKDDQLYFGKYKRDYLRAVKRRQENLKKSNP